jgi:multidrug resistance efflux pump
MRDAHCQSIRRRYSGSREQTLTCHPLLGVWRKLSGENLKATAAQQWLSRIAAREVKIASEIGGLVAEVNPDEGALVRKGDVLFRVDGSMLLAQRAQAEATVKMAHAQRDQLVAGARPEQIEVARAISRYRPCSTARTRPQPARGWRTTLASRAQAQLRAKAGQTHPGYL